MSKDRKVSTDALETLGTIIGPTEKRDAIHLAVIPVTAKTTMAPGTHVNHVGLPAEPFVGIVDPFLERVVMPGEMFWLVIYPRKITSLRHVWSHPSFPEEPAAVPPVEMDSEAWLRAWCKSHDVPEYEVVMAAVVEHIENSWSEEYLTIYGHQAYADIPEEFWYHVSVVLGREIKPREKAKYFSCSC